jgi:hypothetical protein
MAKYNGEWDADPRIQDGIGTVETRAGTFKIRWERYMKKAIWDSKPLSHSDVRIEFLNEKAGRKCLDHYNWSSLRISISKSGSYWLIVDLNDSYYGSPEYKIQDVKIGGWNHLKTLK